MIYELWSGASANLLAGFDTEAEALQVIADTIDKHGRAAAKDLGLLAVDETKPNDDESAVTLLTEGEALIARALAATADRVAV